ncbi:MAG TPA: exosortase F system-associated protein [Flavobacterium alvei]|uniref:exosortase F system-associated membrane protein n=1 Tax=Flavobacterium alvei TaxID=2080416 RepID=UPI0026EFDFAF|nr:exosortase F system-associated protein [Flavobacterium alvei]HQE33688.1 exosortase F system-associated protein [Flavobacterium alvei]HQF48803.1 exosortase F system-associated protein [Flavobacterium alvei]HQK39200.1 exosortase F system-associated protein [Flavobacterium alvei]
MLQKLLNHKARIALATLFAIGLVVIRAYEDSLFYDPFLNYFKTDYYNLPIPEIDNFKLFLGLFFRYFMNTVLSLAIIYVLFKDIDAIKFASFLYSLFFVILIIALFFILLNTGETNKMGLFYIRRFLIQPLFLLLFLPAFYYQKQKK